MTSTTHPFSICVGVDFEDSGTRALDAAIGMAGLMHDAEIHAVYVASPDEMLTRANVPHPDSDEAPTEAVISLQRLEKLCRDRLTAAQAANGALRFRRIVTHVGVGDRATALVDLAERFDTDLVVVGTHDRTGLKRLVLGSVAEDVMRLVRCPVLVARRKDHENLGDVPTIEPPCPDCIAVQRRANDPLLWCEHHAHAKYHPATHSYSYVYRGGGGGTGKPQGPTVA